MKTKIESEYRDYRFGFEVILRNVPMIFVRGEWALNIHAGDYRRAVLLALTQKPGPLTGDEVYFIRHWMEHTTTAFGDLLGVSHAAVLKWEAKRDKPAKIAPGTEFRLRVLVMKALPKELRTKILSDNGTDQSETDPDSLFEAIEKLWQRAKMPALNRPVEVSVEAFG